ncbi:unnamed protein product [Boreogadus saida]
MRRPRHHTWSSLSRGEAVDAISVQGKHPVQIQGQLEPSRGECQCHFVEVARRTKFGVIGHVEQLTPSPVKGQLMPTRRYYSDPAGTWGRLLGSSWGEEVAPRKYTPHRGVKMNPLSDAAININRCTDGAPHSHVVP